MTEHKSRILNAFQNVIALRMASPYYKIPFEWQRIWSMLGWALILFLVMNQFSLSDMEEVAVWLTQAFA